MTGHLLVSSPHPGSWCPASHLTLNLLLRRRKPPKSGPVNTGLASPLPQHSHRGCNPGAKAEGAGLGPPLPTAQANCLCPTRRAESPGPIPDQSNLERVIFSISRYCHGPNLAFLYFLGGVFATLSSFIKILFPPAGITTFLIYMQIKPWEQMLLPTLMS